MADDLGGLIAGAAPLLASHLALVLVALAVAVAIGLPLAVALVRRPRLAAAVMTVAGAIQTVPSLALLALMVPLLAASHGLGVGLSSFGFAPAAIALTLYALLPIVRNAVTGLRGVDAAAVEAARGMGMAPRQLLRLVELPLAAPVIAAGIRTASVWTVGTATLATPIGQACLGNYIFAGLQTRNWAMLLIGVVAAAALALALDAILAAAERAVSQRPRGRLIAPGAALAVVVVGVLGVLPRLARPAAESDAASAQATTPAPSTAAPRSAQAPLARVRIGAKTFTEQYILAEVLRQRLAGRGIAGEIVASLGSNVVFDALRRGDLDAYVDYSGTLWTTQLGRDRGAPRWQILSEVDGQLARDRVRSLGPLGFQNAYAVAVRRDAATRLGLHSLADLGRHPGELAFGADYEFLSRREWAALRATYGLAFRRTASFDPALLYEAAARGEVDAISAFSSDGRIAAYDLVVLDDPGAALPSYDAMILLGPRATDDTGVVCALAPLRGALPVDLMRRANLRVDHDRATPADAAAWLLGEAAIAETCDPPARP